LNINEILKIQGQLFTQPEKAWLEIKKSEFSWTQILIYYLIPLLFLSSLATVFFMGNIFEKLGLTPNQVFFINFTGSILGIFVSASLITRMAPRFNAKPSFSYSVALISFGYSPVYLAAIISSAHDILQIINLIAIGFVVYIFLKGTGALMDVPQHKQFGFTVVCLIILFATRIIISAMIAAMMGIGKV
jgi:cytochrome b561